MRIVILILKDKLRTCINYLRNVLCQSFSRGTTLLIDGDFLRGLPKEHHRSDEGL